MPGETATAARPDRPGRRNQTGRKPRPEPATRPVLPLMPLPRPGDNIRGAGPERDRSDGGPGPDDIDAMTATVEALDGRRGPDATRILRAALRLLETLLRKNADYGASAFESPRLVPGMAARDALMVRMSDKVARLRNLASGTKPDVADESLRDTVADLGGYCILWLAETDRQKAGRDTAD